MLDVSKLKVFPKDVEENLGELYKDYTDFKKIYVVTPEEVVTKMQMQRVQRIAVKIVKKIRTLFYLLCFASHVMPKLY